jgi:imidazolonepropionase-like amidohydrolase
LTKADAVSAANRGTIVVTTLGDLLGMLDTIPRESPAFALAQAVRQLHVDNLKLLSDAGVKLAIGSDSYGDVSVAEAQALARLGVFDNRRMLNLWSRDTPQAIFPGRKIGELKPGYEASFVVLAADPLRDFKAVEAVTMVVKRGHRIDLAAIGAR